MSDPVSNKSGREALRGAEVHTLDFIFELLTSQQWAELLRAPLQRAAAKGNRGLAQRLVRAGAEIGDALLHEAVRGGNGEIVGDLLESGASFTAKDTKGRTPLHIAADLGQTEMVELLLLKGADKDACNNQEHTPLYLAVQSGKLATALALLAAGADVSRQCSELGITVIHPVARHGPVEILRAVIEHGADVDAPAVGINQSTALHCAAWNNNVEAIDVLVEAGANIEARACGGYTPLHLACGMCSREALLSLLKHGATINAQDNGANTPLMVAVYQAGAKGAAEVVDSLLRAGADEAVVNNDGNKAADMIGLMVEDEDRLPEDFERVRQLLANAPVDRAWRRRGHLVLCRALPDKMQQNQVISDTHHTDTARRTRSRAMLARAGGDVGGSTVLDEVTGGDWAVVVAKVVSLQEEGIFRTIVGYL